MSKKFQLAAIFITVFIDLVGFGILIPVLPTYALTHLNATEFEVGLIIAGYSFMQFIFNPIVGQLSDNFGRRPFILGCLFLMGATYMVFPLAKSFLGLFIIRIFAGVAGSNIGVAQAYIADITTKEERTKGMSMIGIAFGLGFIIGPVLGGVLSHRFGAHFIGYFSGTFSFLAFLFAYFALPESVKEFKSSKIELKVFDISRIANVLKIKTVGLLVFLFFIVTFSIANVFGTLPLLGALKYKMNDGEIGMSMGAMGVVGIFTQGFLTHYLEHKLGNKKLLLIAMLVLSLGLSLIPFGVSMKGLMIAVAIFGVGQGTLQSLLPSLISKVSPDKKQGAILGVNQSLSALGRTLGPLWGGFSFHYINYSMPYITGAMFSMVTFFIALKKLKINI